MSDEQALLRAIVAAPEDDTLRLVYADWLQENGQAERAEFIRIECEQDRCWRAESVPEVWESPRYWELSERRDELSRCHAADWFEAFFRLNCGDIATDRGFPSRVILTARKFIDCGADVFRTVPTIENVDLNRLGRNMPELARAPALEHVRRLTFVETPVRSSEAVRFAASPHLGNLQKLHFVRTRIGPEGAHALARAESVRQLRILDIGYNRILDAGAGALLASERLATVNHLDLTNTGLSDATLGALARTTMRLTQLSLMNNQLTGSGLAALRAARLGALEVFSVSQNPIGDAGPENLIRASFAAGLRELDVALCGLDDGAIATLLGGEWPELRDLSLSLNDFETRAVRALAANRSLERLEKLSAFLCEIDPTVARALGRVSLPALRALDVSKNALGPNGLRGLLGGPLARPLRKLGLYETELGDDGAEVLARSPAAANLRSVQLENNRITNRGALALAESPHLEAVLHLAVAGNEIGKKGRAALARRFGARVDFGGDE